MIVKNEYIDVSIGEKKYHLITDKEVFDIEHRCGFINSIKTRINNIAIMF